ncbi:MAG: PKD domain-containing protein, partial [Bacteroidales bacterium]|nr:PKD domain-containing protein [Bacteroidales bacterium]
GGFLTGLNSGTLYNGRRYAGEIAEIIAFNTVDDNFRYSVQTYIAEKYFPDFLEPSVSLGLDIHVPYGFCDTAITTAYNPDFISYQWSTGETDSVIHANRTGRYTVTVTNSFGVTSTDDINVYFPEHNQLQDTTICAGDTILWNIKMRQDEYTFQWYKDGEQYGDASNQIEISEAGAYSCIITDSLGCTFQTDTAHITIDNYPISAGFGANDTTLCYGNRLHIASGYSETTSAIWQDGNTALEYYLTQPGSYTVTTTNTRGCTATNSINVNLRGQVPTPNFSIEGHCQNIPINIIDLSTSAIGDITARQWYANDSLIGSGTEINHSFAEFGMQKVKLFLETSDNCLNDTTIFVYIDPQPQPDFSPKSFCQNAETEINTQHTIAEGEIVSTLWTIEGENLYGDNISKSFAGTDLVPVTITAESAVGCSGSHTYEVVVRQTEKPAMNISGLCLGSATEFTNTTPFSNTNPQIAWEWSFGDNTGISSRKNPVHIYDSIGNYTISMSVTFANHCTTSIDTTISIFLQPEASIITANGCIGGHTEMLANISSDDHIYNYRWSIGDIYESNEAQPIFIADSAGFFPVSLEITTDHLCKAVATGYLNIHGHLNVSFTQSRDWGGSPLYVEFENTSEDATSYHWNFGGAGESNQTNPYFIFTEPGTYEVSLTGTNEFGCTGRYTSPAITVVEPIVDIMLMDLKANEENGFAKISLIIVNLGTLPVEDLVLELKINNQIYRETIGHIAQGAVVPHTFGTMIPIPNSASIANTICVEALVPDSEGHSETNLANNTLCITDAENLSVGIPYPIPAYEQITCDIYTKIPTDLDISIFSIFGKLVKHETISQHKGYMKYVVNVTDLSGGMYFIRVNSKDESITHKFEIR